MAIKKATPVKTDRSSGEKKAVKKIASKSTEKVSEKKAVASKKAVAPAKKVAAKKIATKKVAAKKVLAPSKGEVTKKSAAAKKTASKVAKELPSKSIKSSFLKKGDKNTSKGNDKLSGKVKKDANQLLVDAAVEGILEVKGKDITVLDLRGINNRVCDYYIICQADSSTQVNAIANSVEVMVKKQTGERPYHSEGFQNSEWILVDYVTVVVHVFQTQIREFYNLESLWADAEITKIAHD